MSLAGLSIRQVWSMGQMLGIAPGGELEHPWIGLMQLCSLCGDHSRHRDAVRITALKPPERGHQRKFDFQSRNFLLSLLCTPIPL